MRTSYLLKLASLLLMSLVVWACTDHETDPPNADHFRLKTTNVVVRGGAPSLTEYGYDAQNRLILSRRANGPSRSFSYDAQNRYQSSEYTPPSGAVSPDNVVQRTRFMYESASKNFVAETYVVQNGIETLFLRSYYTVDANNDVTQIRKTDPQGNLVRLYRYEYTGHNITTEIVGEEGKVGPGRGALFYFYTYDDKPNPYYGLVGPNNDLTEADNNAGVRRFSQNNVTRLSFTTDVTNSYYTYNSLGLPVSVKDSAFQSLRAQTTFSYESY